MPRSREPKIVRPLPKGQITIPAAIRRALDITDSSLLEIAIEGQRIVISKLDRSAGVSPRLYSDEEVAEFLAEDEITPDTAARVRQLMRAGLV